MNLKTKLLLATLTAVSFANLYTEDFSVEGFTEEELAALAAENAEGIEEDQIKGTRRENKLKVNQIRIYNGEVDGTLSVANLDVTALNVTNETVATLIVTGTEYIHGNLIVTGTVVAGEVDAGNVVFSPLAVYANTNPLNAVGSLETVGARLIWANVASNATFNKNSGFFSVTPVSTGIYELQYDLTFSNANSPVLVANAASNTGAYAEVSYASLLTCTVQTYSSGGTATNEAFNIIGVGA